MGIKQLMLLLKEKAPGCIREKEMENLNGNIVACDASMAMYQFLIMTQGFSHQQGLVELTDKDGNRTGHLIGLMNRTIQFLESGVRPIWVFDGAPPKMKNGELARRKKLKEEAKEKTENAEEEGNIEEALKNAVRTTTISKTMKEDCKEMLKLLGVPVIEAPCEAEAQCAAIVKAGKAYATVTEDMDALTFGTKYLLRGFQKVKEPIVEICFDDMLRGLGMNYEEFVDLCILCGCDYTQTIEGIGPVTAYKLIQDYKSIEKVLAHLESENRNPSKKRKYVIPDPFPYEDARELFLKPQVETDMSKYEFKWKKPDEEALTKFLVEGKGFNEVRVQSALKRISKVDLKSAQSRLDSFFTKKPPTVKTKENPVKEKDMKGKDKDKKGKVNPFAKK